MRQVAAIKRSQNVVKTRCHEYGWHKSVSPVLVVIMHFASRLCLNFIIKKRSPPPEWWWARILFKRLMSQERWKEDCKSIRPLTGLSLSLPLPLNGLYLCGLTRYFAAEKQIPFLFEGFFALSRKVSFSYLLKPYVQHAPTCETESFYLVQGTTFLGYFTTYYIGKNSNPGSTPSVHTVLNIFCSNSPESFSCSLRCLDRFHPGHLCGNILQPQVGEILYRIRSCTFSIASWVYTFLFTYATLFKSSNATCIFFFVPLPIVIGMNSYLSPFFSLPCT